MSTSDIRPEQLLPNLYRFADSCNVYVIRKGDRAIAVDFGSGRWMQALPGLGINQLEHVFLTHHHSDQCAGLQAQEHWPFTIHAPSGEEKFLSPEGQRRGTFDRRGRGCPDSYAVLKGGLQDVRYDMAGFGDFIWRDARIRFLHTPGHGPHACSVIADIEGRQAAFCGDAAHAGGTIWQPFHLEWDHWTGQGALAAWEGITRLQAVGLDLLCPAHGPVIADLPRNVLAKLQTRLMAFYLAKGQISPGEADNYVSPTLLKCGARLVLPGLYQFGTNGYLLRSRMGEGLVVDPQQPDLRELDALLSELGSIKVTVATATHYHADHCDALPFVRERFGARVVLHPMVAEPLHDVQGADVPWLPAQSIQADELWPERGVWNWNEYEFDIAPWPGQTHWHCIFMTRVAGQSVGARRAAGQRAAFGGDSFQPSTRWNGTGGFCAYNSSRFEEGFVRSAELLLRWRPDVLACGHGTYYRFKRSKFHKIITWAQVAERATRELCPSGDLQQDYYLIGLDARQRIETPGAFFWIEHAQ